MSVTVILIGLTVAISFYTFNTPSLMARLMMNPYLIQTKGQYYRFISSGFIHNDHVHLLWNMFAFYIFGNAVERDFGVLFGEAGLYYFVVLYLTACALKRVLF